MRGFAVVFLGVLTAGVCISWAAAPEPALVPGPGLWTVRAEFTHPQQIFLRTGPDNKPKRFWYTLVTITNNTGKDADFYPKCELMTDTFEIIPAGKAVTPAVFERIQKRHAGLYQFLLPLEKAGDRILQGEDNTIDIAVIWPDFDAKANKIKIFITGLSNETAAVDHPVAKDKDGAPVKVFLRKTLELAYDLEGDSATRSNANLVFEGRRWIMR